MKKKQDEVPEDGLKLFFTGVILCVVSWIVLVKLGENHFFNMQFFGIGFIISYLIVLLKDMVSLK